MIFGDELAGWKTGPGPGRRSGSTRATLTMNTSGSYDPQFKYGYGLTYGRGK